jgi:hypothetical protein
LIQLNCAEDYFLNVLRPNRDQFFSHPSSFVTALNLATSLFHFHEWLWAYHRSDLESHFGQPIQSPRVLWGIVENINPNFGYVRDLTNASKHVTIGQHGHKTSTGMTHIANTHIITTGFGVGGYGQGRYGGGPDVVFDDAGSQISFDQCASDMFAFWKTLLETLTGQFYI